MSLSKSQRIFTANVAKLIVYANEVLCIELTFGEVFRTPEQQEIYYRTGKSKTRNSNHLRRLAVDFNYFIDNKLTYDFDKVEKLGDYWESLHPANRWGGDFNNDEIENGFVDTPHFEMNI